MGLFNCSFGARKLARAPTIGSRGNANSNSNGRTSSYSSSSFASTSDIGELNTDLRVQQKLLYIREEVLYRKWLMALKYNRILKPGATNNRNNDFGAAESNGLLKSPVLMLWGRHVSLLSSKLAHAMARHSRDVSTTATYVPLVVSVLSDHHSISAQRASNELMGVRNNIIGSMRLSIAQFAALLAAPDRASLSIFQVDIFVRVMSLAVLGGSSPTTHNYGGASNKAVCAATGALLEEMLASLLHTCYRCLLEVPSAGSLRATMQHLLQSSSVHQGWDSKKDDKNRGLASDPGACTDMLMGEYAREARESAHLSSDGQASTNLAAPVGLLLKAAKRLVSTDQGDNPSINIVERAWSPEEPQIRESDGEGAGAGTVLLEVSIPKVRTGAKSCPKGSVSLYTLLHLGVEPSMRRKLLSLAVDLPLGAKVASIARLLVGVASGHGSTGTALESLRTRL